MNISGKSINVPTACVAVVTIVVAAIVSSLVGIGLGTVMAQPNKAPTTVLMVQPTQESAGPVDPYMNPRSAWMYSNDIPYWTGEDFTDELNDQADSQTVLPAPNPLDISLLQSDGESVQCKPFRSVVRKDVAADGIAAINNTLLDLRTNSDGDLMVSPRDLNIQSRRIAIVVNGAHAAWLPATAAGSSVTLDAYTWLPDITMWWRLQVCAFTG
jgi:hypothetical protein